MVADMHGYGGINLKKLDPRARMQRAFPILILSDWMKPSTAYATSVKHAKASSEKAHICHTGSFDVIDHTINGCPSGVWGNGLLREQLKVPEILQPEIWLYERSGGFGGRVS